MKGSGRVLAAKGSVEFGTLFVERRCPEKDENPKEEDICT